MSVPTVDGFWLWSEMEPIPGKVPWFNRILPSCLRTRNMMVNGEMFDIHRDPIIH